MRTVGEKLRYQKKAQTGVGSLVLDGNRTELKSGAVFEAYPHEIPEGFRDLYETIDGGIVEEPATKVSEEAKLRKVMTGKGWYDVVNAVTGKPINDKRLRLRQADDLIEEEAHTVHVE